MKHKFSISPPINLLNEVAYHIRTNIFKMIANTRGGHLGGNSSSVELFTALYFGGYLNYDVSDPQNPNRDRVLVRGHIGPVRYTIFSLLNWLNSNDLTNYRKLGSKLHGHEWMQATPGVDITPSGSLGMLLSYAVGCCVAAKNRHWSFKTVVFLGDGEEQEGNVSEAARHASHYQLDNLICIIDANEKQLSSPTLSVDSATDLTSLWEGYGWSVLHISNGHDIEDILSTMALAEKTRKPVLIIAKTIKGNQILGADNHFSGYHTVGTCPPDILEVTIRKRESEQSSNFEEVFNKLTEWISELAPYIRPSSLKIDPDKFISINITPARKDVDNSRLNIAQRYYFQRLSKILQKHSDIKFYTLTADFIPSNVIQLCGFEKLGLVIDVGLREQHLIAMAYGISVTDPCARFMINYGDAFLYRALDQIHSVAQGNGRLLIVLEASGVSMAENGVTHQSTGQPGALLTMPNAILLEPADCIDLYNCLNWAYSYNPGLVCIRTHGIPIDPIQTKKKHRNISAYVAYETDSNPQAVIVASGFVVGNAIESAKLLALKNSVSIRVINVINMKTLDEKFVSLLRDNIPVLTIYNGNPFVLQSSVASAVLENPTRHPSKILSHGFTEGTTGEPNQLISYLGLDVEGIMKKILLMV